MKKCSVDGCEDNSKSLGYCGMHYARFKRHDDPLCVPVKPIKPACSVKDCKKKSKSLGYCNMHYSRLKRHGDPLYVAPTFDACIVDNCNGKYYARGYCSVHYIRHKKYGDPLRVSRIIGENRVAHPLYATYRNMIDRCNNKNSKRYKDWGGRGIKVCDRWLGIHGFTNFIADMDERPQDCTLDRVDNNLGYSPENCRWATRTQQMCNQRQRPNRTGYPGVRKHGNKYQSKIRVEGKHTYLGTFLTAEEASRVYQTAKLKRDK